MSIYNDLDRAIVFAVSNAANPLYDRNVSIQAKRVMGSRGEMREMAETLGAETLTDEQIDALMPEPDGSAEANVERVEVLPGVMGKEYDEVDAWSRPLVRQVVRAALAA